MKINVIEWLQEAVIKSPDSIACEDKTTSYTFAEINSLAQNISTHICKTISNKHIPIAVFLPKSCNALIAFLGILHSGNIYMPLDIRNPRERIEKILQTIEPEIIITDKKNLPAVAEINSTCIVLLIEDILQTDNAVITYNNTIDTDGAYIINTSGSTGMPKGVIISHRSIIDYIEWATKAYSVTDKEIIGSQSPFYFDNSVLDIYLMLKNRCKLVLIPEELFSFPVKLLEFLAAKNITCIFFVPSILTNIAKFDLLKSNKPNLQKILFAGEVMPAKTLNYWTQRYPDTLFSNLYGPTEITVDCTYYIVDRKFNNDEPIPIGKKCRNSDVFLLDENNTLISAPNMQGEICVRGTSLALGYYNNHEKTKEVFVQNPLNPHYEEKIYKTGDIAYYNDREELIYVGRKDFQIKHNGYRIELGEIETALGIISEIHNLCVSYDDKNAQIILYYEAEKDLSSQFIISSLKNKLPKYMIPTKLIRLDKLPTNANGKIDRLALKKSLA